MRALKTHLREHGIPVRLCALVSRDADHADSIDRSQRRRRRPARAGREARDQGRRRVSLGAALRAISQGAGDRPRCGDGHRRQPRHSSGRSRARCRAASAAASAPSHARATCWRPARSRSSPGRRCSRTDAPISNSRSRCADAVGRDRVIAAVDSRGGHVVIHGWKTALPLTAVDAVRALEPYCDEFLYTHVDKEGLMGGTDFDAILAVKRRDVTPSDGRRRHHDAKGDRRPGRARRRRRRRHGDLHRYAQRRLITSGP